MPDLVHFVRKGMNKPVPNSVIISGSSKFRNPFVVEKQGKTWGVTLSGGNARSPMYTWFLAKYGRDDYLTERLATRAATDIFRAMIFRPRNVFGRKYIVETLSGKTLRCECAFPDECHGVVYLDVIAVSSS